MISIIAAMDFKGRIGEKGQLPWRIPEDLKRFKEITMGKPVVMGRKTWESLPGKLTGRTNIVITRNPEAVKGDFDVCTNDLKGALEYAGILSNEVMVIGGGEIYRQSLPFVDRMYLTRVCTFVKGDTLFPFWYGDDWELTKSEKVQTSSVALDFQVYDRVTKWVSKE